MNLKITHVLCFSLSLFTCMTTMPMETVDYNGQTWERSAYIQQQDLDVAYTNQRIQNEINSYNYTTTSYNYMPPEITRIYSSNSSYGYGSATVDMCPDGQCMKECCSLCKTCGDYSCCLCCWPFGVFFACYNWCGGGENPRIDKMRRCIDFCTSIPDECCYDCTKNAA